MTLENTNAMTSILSFPCMIAHSPEERDLVYQLRHEAYRRDESIDAHPEGRFSDHYDNLPNSFSFLVRHSSTEAAATVRISVVRPDLGWNEAPSRTVFAGDPSLDEIAREGYVEASRLCFGPLARRDAFVKLLGNMAALADVFETGWLIACPRVEHTRVYENLFGFRKLAGARQYFGVRFQTQLLGIRREEIRQFVRDQKCMQTAWQDALARLRAEPGLVC